MNLYVASPEEFIERAYMRTVLEPVLMRKLAITKLIYCYSLTKDKKNWMCKAEMVGGEIDYLEVDFNLGAAIRWKPAEDIGEGYYIKLPQEVQQGAVF